MRLYRIYSPGEQELLAWSPGDDTARERILSPLRSLGKTSPTRLALEFLVATLFGNKVRRGPLEFAIQTVMNSLKDEWEFAEADPELEFRVSFIKNQTELVLFPSYRLVCAPKTAGWLQRRLLVLRGRSYFWIFLPKP